MTQFPVKYKLYDSTGVSLLYTFQYVQSDNSPQDPKDYVEISSLRGVGSIIIPGSTQAWDLNLRFFIKGVDYSDVIAQMDALQTTIAPLTAYTLKIDRTASTTQSFKVMRLAPFEWEDNFRNDFLEVTAVFRVNSWN